MPTAAPAPCRAQKYAALRISGCGHRTLIKFASGALDEGVAVATSWTTGPFPTIAYKVDEKEGHPLQLKVPICPPDRFRHQRRPQNPGSRTPKDWRKEITLNWFKTASLVSVVIDN